MDANGRECNNPFLEGMLRFIRVASRPFAVKKQALGQAARECRGSVLECGRPCRFPEPKLMAAKKGNMDGQD
jgi:hypothetical protein